MYDTNSNFSCNFNAIAYFILYPLEIADIINLAYLKCQEPDNVSNIDKTLHKYFKVKKLICI